MMRPNQLDADRACVLVIDVQEKLLPLVRDHDAIVSAIQKLLTAAPIFELPVIVTEQYPRGIGHTVEAVSACLERGRDSIIEKSAFSAWAEPSVREAILAVDRPQGFEVHHQRVSQLLLAVPLVDQVFELPRLLLKTGQLGLQRSDPVFLHEPDRTDRGEPYYP